MINHRCRCAWSPVESFDVEWLAAKITDLFRPWYDPGLPDELAFGEIKHWWIIGGAMGRAARMAVSLDIEFGVFGIIGIECAHRAARAWLPRERLLMEYISFAYEPISSRARLGQWVPQIHKDRLVFLLDRYLAYVGKPREEEHLREALERLIAEFPRDMPEDTDDAAE